MGYIIYRVRASWCYLVKYNLTVGAEHVVANGLMIYEEQFNAKRRTL